MLIISELSNIVISSITLLRSGIGIFFRNKFEETKTPCYIMIYFKLCDVDKSDIFTHYGYMSDLHSLQNMFVKNVGIIFEKYDDAYIMQIIFATNESFKTLHFEIKCKSCTNRKLLVSIYPRIQSKNTKHFQCFIDEYINNSSITYEGFK